MSQSKLNKLPFLSIVLNSESGFSLLEMIVAIGVAVGISMAVGSYFKSFSQDQAGANSVAVRDEIALYIKKNVMNIVALQNTARMDTGIFNTCMLTVTAAACPDQQRGPLLLRPPIPSPTPSPIGSDIGIYYSPRGDMSPCFGVTVPGVVCPFRVTTIFRGVCSPGGANCNTYDSAEITYTVEAPTGPSGQSYLPGGKLLQKVTGTAVITSSQLK